MFRLFKRWRLLWFYKRLPDLRSELSKKQRRELELQIQHLRDWLLPALLRKQRGLCPYCGEPILLTDRVEIHHLKYHPEITINFLQALHYHCHPKADKRGQWSRNVVQST